MAPLGGGDRGEAAVDLRLPPLRRRPRAGIRSGPSARRRRPGRRRRAGELTCVTDGTAASCVVDVGDRGLEAGSSTVRRWLWTRTTLAVRVRFELVRVRPRRGRTRPDTASASVSCCWPTAPPIASETTTKASHPKMAVLRWVALQRAARAAMFDPGLALRFLSVAVGLDAARLPAPDRRSNAAGRRLGVRVLRPAWCGYPYPRTGPRCRTIAPMPTSVLIVDDHPSFRPARGGCWRRAATSVVGEAEDGAAALAAARELRPDLVLLDVQLPDIDGFEVAARLEPRSAAAPTIVLTSSRDERRLRRRGRREPGPRLHRQGRAERRDARGADRMTSLRRALIALGGPGLPGRGRRRGADPDQRPRRARADWRRR